MWRGALVALLLAGCATVHPGFDVGQARQFRSVPGQAVIYLVRERQDRDSQPLVVILDGRVEGLTYPSTFIRWEVTAGHHRIAGFGGDAGVIEFATEPGKIYFVRQKVAREDSLLQSHFNLVGEEEGRTLVTRSRFLASS